MREPSPEFPTKVMRVRDTSPEAVSDFSPRKSWQRDWVEIQNQAKSSQGSTPVASGTVATQAPSQQPGSPSPSQSQAESSGPTEGINLGTTTNKEESESPSQSQPREQTALYRKEIRPDGRADYICFCGHVSKALHGWKVHFGRKHKHGVEIDELRRTGRKGKAVEGHQ